MTDLDDFSNEELIEELEKRGVHLTLLDELMKIYHAMHQNNREEAWKLMTQYVCDKTGRVI